MKNGITEPGISTELNMVDIISMVLTVETTYNIGCSQQFIWVIKLLFGFPEIVKFLSIVLTYFLTLTPEKGHVLS